MEQFGVICSACQQENEAGYQRCSRCGAAADRSIPTLLVLGTFFTREIIWGITLSGLALPLMLLLSGFWGALLLWSGVGFSSYWAIFGFIFLVPGMFFTLSMLPFFRRIQSLLFGLGFIVTFAVMAGAVLGLFFVIYFYNAWVN